MITLGIYGKIGSGKTYVSRFLHSEFDILIFDCDAHAKQILNLEATSELKKKLMALCGVDCFQPPSWHAGGHWNAKYISELAKQNPEILDKIGEIILPYLLIKIQKFKQESEGYGKPICAIESALF